MDMKKKDNAIEQQLFLFLEKSNDPWSIKDRDSRYLFINKAALQYYGIPLGFNYLGCLDNELPHPGSELAEEFKKNDKIIIEEEKTIIEIETHIYGKDKRLQPHFCKKSPFYDKKKQCVGVICQGLDVQNLHIYDSFFENAPKLLSTNPPISLFTKRELDVIFFAQQRLSCKEIARQLNIAPRTIEHLLNIIYQKADVHSVNQFAEYCKSMGLNKHIPENLLRKGVIVFNN
ncbi:PAS domain-containing protein [Candidatus Hamiltonella defensa]|uniref:HTH luxR-type domain-containing protein n=2 Tax=Candidatus Williamhamiltonella defendens TaxID=138072 RepID=A0AAC9VK63_9ENTR|nr:PAS and helix-turn-helix domain-containing protein [Candidatus Hamiltonella defensa]ASV34478.1 hypothetical protein CJJ18_10655 [Candidatus Hamiltonella defensa]AWK17434.1 hypothetical protein CCS40_10470 [Candidatus Hamiltonella defensa]MBK4361711.1 PAS domain-containing protein [Candidatus Hamiltonella defensa]